jgi:RNA polymerase sigma-70 factor (ECF subfamily)
MTTSRTDLYSEFPFQATAGPALPTAATEIEYEVLGLFGQFRSPLLRYVLSFGIPMHDAEEVFLSLFRHLQLGKSRKNLRSWIFCVAHNLALKQREANQKLRHATATDWTIAERQFDPSLNPEEQVTWGQRRQRLLGVLHALPQHDQFCLRLRAEGLRYREIAKILGISLGAVSLSLTRSLARLMRADGS